ncbi:MAG: CotH kinase family protein [Bacteroidaceae bacterium]|nr:CotH kinase family protein [Bacteroidaceae bacterium]
MLRRLFFLTAWLFISLSPSHAEPVFNRLHGVCKSPFLLKISSSETGVVIRYTLDGSEPVPTSPQFTSNIYVKSTTIIRAAEFRDDVRCSDIVTSSYIFPASVLEQPALPEGYPSTWGKYVTMSGTAPADYEMDPELTSISTYAKKIKDAFYSIPVVSIVTDKGNLFNKQKDEQTGGIYIYVGNTESNGRGWERPASVELMGEGHDLTTTCGLKIHGGQSRLPEKSPKHSFRLTFKDEYGKKTLKYPVFGEGNVARFNSLIVRSFYNYSWIHREIAQSSCAQYVRDLWARHMQKRMGYPTSDGLYVNLFIDGLYWGLYNLAERIDDDYCKYHFGGLKSDYDVIKREDYLEASEGTLDKWNQLINTAQKATLPETYGVIIGETASEFGEPETLLDVDNFIDYMLINQYGGNADWDHHNWIAFKNREDSTQGFRFICWDSEQVLVSASKNVLGLNNMSCPSGLFLNMMKNPAFKHRFWDRAYALLEDDGGLLRPEPAQALWDSLQSVISLAIYAESARWGDYRKDVHPYGSTRAELYRADVHYVQENKRMHEEFFPQRTENLIAQLKNKGWYANADAPVFLVNGEKVMNGDTILLSDELTLSQGSYILYTTDGSDPVTWAKKSGGEETSQAVLYSKENIAKSLVPGEVTLRAICKNSSKWSATVTRTIYVVDDLDDFVDVPSALPSKSSGLYNLSGQRVSKPQGQGVYIINGKKYIF